MAHCQKLKVGEVFGILKHNSRNSKEHSNEEIDVSKSHLNTDLMNSVPFPKKKYKEILELGEEYSIQKLKKNANICCSWVVTVPKNLDHAEHTKFFEETNKFLIDRYGVEKGWNIVSSDVHYDETTPHLHFVFMPMYKNEKTNEYQLSAAKVINRNELKMFHNDLKKHLDNAFEKSIDVLNDSTKDRESVSLKEFKTISSHEKKKIDKMLEDIKKDRTELLEQSNQISVLAKQLKQKRLEVESIAEQLGTRKQVLDYQEQELNAQKTHLNAKLEQFEEDKGKYQEEQEKALETLKNASQSILGIDTNEHQGKLIDILRDFIEYLTQVLFNYKLINEVDNAIEHFQNKEKNLSEELRSDVVDILDSCNMLDNEQKYDILYGRDISEKQQNDVDMEL